MTKNELRKLLKSELSAVSADEKVDASKKACSLFFEFVMKNDFDIVLSYIDLKNEISPLEMNRALMMQNKIVAVPKVVPKTQNMNFYILDNSIEISEQVKTGSFGINEPVAKKENLFNAENFMQKKICVVVPGVAFGRKGQRLGHGMGFYDIYLSDLKKKCAQNNCSLFLAGLCFDFQIKENIPVDENDIFMDSVFSDKKYYFFESAE
ncbi:5-formyltetrahydrofolate cyclo-ligase [uncultured Treponema sp.]|mgnify:FL=1|uniref:5-formyltetrahydrofolate cyclo-ligase n=1 Tax=Treponema sp. TaxID=166 RepID=UPI0025E0DE85|nr:5-formyltetrahydrofolate cyclo-ligase [uncultured Treponema sp.]MEE0353125.1 5-formyltetrahydrofolate cyclo-ligase [Treponema sp.]